MLPNMLATGSFPFHPSRHAPGTPIDTSSTTMGTILSVFAPALAPAPAPAPAPYDRIGQMSVTNQERYNRLVARPAGAPQNVAVIGFKGCGKSSVINTANRILSDTWGEDTPQVCATGLSVMAEGFMTSSVKAIHKPAWAVRFLDTPHLLNDVARNPAEMALLRAMLQGVKLGKVLRDRTCTVVS